MNSTRKFLFMAILCLSFMMYAPVCLAAGTGTTTKESEKTSAKSSVTKNQAREGLVQIGDNYYYYENGRKLRRAWRDIKDEKTKKTYRWYFRKDGTAAMGKEENIGGKIYLFDTRGHLVQSSKSKIVRVEGNYYYVNSEGRVSMGWLLIKGKLYYADERGKFCKTEKDGITFDKTTGAAKDSTASQLKIKTMSIISSITTSKMSKAQKLRACWNYVTHNGGCYYDPEAEWKGWMRGIYGSGSYPISHTVQSTVTF